MQYYFDGGGFHSTPSGVAMVVTILAIVAMLIVASVVKTAIRARYGGRQSVASRATDGDLTATPRVELLVRENAGLQGQVARLEERLSILEHGAKDPARRIAFEIDSLR